MSGARHEAESSPHAGKTRSRRLTGLGAATAVLVGVIASVGIWLNGRVPPGGILEDAIVDPDDPYVRQYEEVRHEFWGSDFIALVQERPFGPDAVRDYVRMRRRLEAKIPGARFGILSLDTLPNLRIEDGMLLTAPYLPPGGDADLDAARRALGSDRTVRKVLFSPDLSKLAHVIVLPKGFDQSEVYWSLVEILEEHSVPWWERLVRYSITPVPENAHWWPLGWPLGREAISRMLPAETTKLIGVGLVVVGVLYWVSTGSMIFALLGTSLLVVTLVWIRASIPVLDCFTLFRERPYVILAHANTLVQGASFVLLASFVMRERDREDRRVLVILGAFTLLLGLGNMASLWWSFAVRAIREMAVLSGIGLVLIYVLSQACLPLWVRELPGDEKREGRGLRGLRRVIGAAGRLRGRGKPLVLLVAAVVLAVVAFPRIPLGSDPLAFIRGHLVERAFERMQDSGMWADGMWIMLRPRGDGTAGIYDPPFLAAAGEMVARIEALPLTSATGSILPTVRRLTREEFGRELPASEEEARIVFQYIEDAPMKPGVRQSMYTPRALQIVCLQRHTNTSLDTRDYRAAIEQIAGDFPGIEVSFGGQSSQYARIDEMIWRGKLYNIATQIGWNFVGYWLVAWFLVATGRRRGHRSAAVSCSRLSAVMSLPFIFATAAMVIVMAVWRVRLDQANAAYLAMANSAANDFTMYFGALYAARVLRTGDIEGARRAAFRLKGEQVLTDAVLNAACFTPLLLSAYEPVRQLGWMTPVMLCFCAFGVLVIMPPFLPWAVRAARNDAGAHESRYPK